MNSSRQIYFGRKEREERRERRKERYRRDEFTKTTWKSTLNKLSRELGIPKFYHTSTLDLFPTDY
eukprot:scaffold92217_cov68-Cyclotella_meneghiniana.AAC.8